MNIPTFQSEQEAIDAAMLATVKELTELIAYIQNDFNTSSTLAIVTTGAILTSLLIQLKEEGPTRENVERLISLLCEED